MICPSGTVALTSVEGCGWAVTTTLRVGEDWPSGLYRMTLSAEGRDGTPIRSHHMFIVTPANGPKPGRILQVAATGTWLAYNTWGGSNHYEGITGPNRTDFARAVSTQRPWCRGFVALPPEAPRVPLTFDMPPRTVPRYPHMEWAYATGHSKKYASSGWATYDSHFFRWAEREYESGRHVVIGGDFNLELVETRFPNTTERKYLFWVHRFPDEGLPAGWRIAADPGTPSVRTNERPYRRGENYTTVIDGFIVSPNVAVESVQGVDLDFQNADHNPVRVRVRATGR